MSPDEVIAALTTGNTISPSGNVRIGKMMPIVPINSLVRDVKELETIPIRPGQDPTVYIRDVATVQDASDIPTGYALVNGRRAVYILVTKRADASTLSVVHNVKDSPAQDAGGPARRHQGQLRVRPVADRHQRRAEPGDRGRPRRGPDRADGAALPPRLAERHRRRPEHPVRPLRGAGGPVAHGPDDQPDDPGRPGAGHRHPGRRVDRRGREHPPPDGRDPLGRPAVRQGNLETAVPRLLAMLCVLAVFIPSFFMQGAAQALVRPAVAGRRLRDGRVVPALEHVRAGPLDLAAPPPSPCPCGTGRRTLFERGRRRLRPGPRLVSSAGAG